MNKHFFFVTSQSHAALGLFKELENEPDVEICVVTPKKVSGVLTAVKRIHTSWTINKHIPLPLRKKWFEKINITPLHGAENIVVIVDIALKGIEKTQLEALFLQENVKVILVMINSYEASSVGMLEIKKDIKALRWDRVLTFDPVDARKNGWDYLGCCYYSMPCRDTIIDTYGAPEQCDAYFVGGIKGNRERLIMSVFEKLHNGGANARFELMVSGTKRLEKHRYDDVIHYMAGVWTPYQQVLHGVLGANVIIEILQQGQHGPSLRYYEAVCLNRKLITNNAFADKLPYYDSRYVKIIRTADDIDLEWVMSHDEVDYGYDGGFSPVNLIKMLG